MDTKDLEPSVELSRQPLFIGCNDRKLIDIIIEKANDHNKLMSVEDTQIETVVMSGNNYISSYHEWRAKQPEIIERNGGEVLSEDLMKARETAYSVLEKLGLTLKPFTASVFKKLVRTFTNKPMTAAAFKSNIAQLLSTSIVVCSNPEAVEHKKEYICLLTDDQRKNILLGRIHLRLMQINKLHSEIAFLNELVMADPTPDEAVEDQVATSNFDESNEGEPTTSTDHLNDKQ